jgi:hypothetical protein
MENSFGKAASQFKPSCHSSETMQPRYSRHAQQMMEARKITEAAVEAVLRRPIGDPAPGNRPDTISFRGYAPGGRLLKVVVDSVDREFVVTVHDTE